jgi:hypothetical protein
MLHKKLNVRIMLPQGEKMKNAVFWPGTAAVLLLSMAWAGAPNMELARL